MAKTIRKTLRFSEEEYQKITSEIKKVDINFSTFCRSAILKKKIILPIEKNLLFEINKIGNNLNQIAKSVNKKEKIKVLSQLIEIEKALRKLCS